VLDQMLEGVPEADARAVTSANALGLFGFDADVLASAP